MRGRWLTIITITVSPRPSIGILHDPPCNLSLSSSRANLVFAVHPPSVSGSEGAPLSVTAARCSYPLASISAWSKTGVQQASVPSKISSHSLRVFDQNFCPKSCLTLGHKLRSSLGPPQSSSLTPRPLVSAPKNCGSSAATAICFPSSLHS